MSPTARRTDLDGLRAVAVLLVVGFHAGVPALRGAFVAVDVFFVLSGFFLATHLARDLATTGSINIGAIASQRSWRLLPALAVVLLGTLATTLLYAPIDRAAVAQRAIPVAAFVGNLAFAAEGVNYFGTGLNPLLHTWTLGVELQLALLLTLLVNGFAMWGERSAGAAIGNERRWLILRAVMAGLASVAALSFVLAVITNDDAPMWAYFGPHTRFWSFAAGALTAFVTGGGQSALGSSIGRVTAAQLTGLGLLLLPALLYDRTLEYPGVMALAPVTGTILLLLAGDLGASSIPGRVLGSTPLVAAGRLSFAWYLWHGPLMALGVVLHPEIGIVGRLAWGFSALGAAWLTHRLLERPRVTSLVQQAMTGRPLLAAAGVSFAIAAVAGVYARNSAESVRESVHQRFQDARDDDMGHSCWGGRARRVEREECSFGDRRSDTRIALIGDSHASHWLGGLERAAMSQGWQVDAHVMGACPVADLRGLIHGAAARLYRRCAEFQEQTIRRLAVERPRAVILSNADNYLESLTDEAFRPRLSEATWIAGLRRTYARLEQMGIEVIVVRALPWVPFDVPSCLSRRAAGLPFATDCAFRPDREFIARARRAQDEAARGLNVRFLDLNDLVCGSWEGPCATDRGGMVLYTDDNHITRQFSRSLAPELGRRLAGALTP